MTDKCFKGWTELAGNRDGSCCCNCQYHKQDFYHCTTIDRIAYSIATNKPAPAGCVCSLHKGWICTGMEGEGGGAHSGWSEHGMCEMHMRKVQLTDNSG